MAPFNSTSRCLGRPTGGKRSIGSPTDGNRACVGSWDRAEACSRRCCCPVLGVGVRARQPAGHGADTGAEVGPVRDGMCWCHAGHVLPEVVAAIWGDVLGERGRGGADYQSHREHRHAKQSSERHSSFVLAELPTGGQGRVRTSRRRSNSSRSMAPLAKRSSRICSADRWLASWSRRVHQALPEVDPPQASRATTAIARSTHEQEATHHHCRPPPSGEQSIDSDDV